MIGEAKVQHKSVGDSAMAWIIALRDFLASAINNMPLPQGILAMMAFWITVGTVSHGSIEYVAYVAQWIAAIVVMLLGTVSLWILYHEHRRERKLISLGIISLATANILYIFNIDVHLVHIIYSLSTVIVMVHIFMFATMSVGHNRRQ